MYCIHRTIDPDTGVLLAEEYRYNHRLHRDAKEGPALRTWQQERHIVVSETYYWHGRVHRIDGPARLYYNLNGVLVDEEYLRHGRLHRDPKEGPALINRDRTGSVVIREAYFFNDELYRDPADGPVQIGRGDTGKIEFAVYCDSKQKPPPQRPSRTPASYKNYPSYTLRPQPN